MPRARKYSDDAEKLRAFRARHQLVAITVDLPRDVVDGLDEFLKFKDMTKTQVLTKLIRSQLLRKR
ncbi:hypothetical protein [Collimonas antrihumi]|uniref:hypothetical protein n=1 Tax=Collimonas antrihumi TaxID=1940615 RepID=UPI001B8D351C|nr:hypothetical protein [Collimonas antrihumi]